MPDSIMSGSFFLESPVSHSPVPPKLDLAGARSQLFQVPQTPSASSSLYRSISFSRKRTRHEIESEKRRGSELQLQSQSQSHAELTSPAPFVNTDYHLAGGGIDYNANQKWCDETPAELDYRPSRYREPPHLPPPLDVSVESLSSSEIGGIRGRKRSRRESLFLGPTTGPDEKDHHLQPGSAGWGRTVINVVGKVWDFCWTGAFRGFYAGGGRGYRMTAGPSPEVEQQHPWQPESTEKEDLAHIDASQRHDMTPVPGRYPEDYDYDDHENKKTDDNDIRRNWVVLPDNDTQDMFGDGASPSAMKRVNRRSVGSSHSRRRSAVMPRLNKRPATYNGPSNPTSAQQAPSPAKSRESPETQRYVAQMRRREREEDASIRRLNQQLQAMIKEGKEALGTRVEVDDIDMED